MTDRHPAPSLRARRKLRVLVVDDQELNRKLLQAMLSIEGHEVLEAVDGAQAVALFERARPDLVLMDLLMPVMDGYEATRRIKQLAGDAFVPVICLSAQASEQALAAAFAAGADDFLTKPYQRVALLARIAAVERLRAAASDGPGARRDAPPDPSLLRAMADAPWHWRVELGAATLRVLDPPALALTLLERCGLPAGHRENLYTVVAELCNNAIDHGVLRLDSARKCDPEGFAAYYVERQRRLEALSDGTVALALHHEPRPDGGCVTIQVIDSGAGFDYQYVLAGNRAARDGGGAPCGRGIALVLGLCESLRYDDAGRRAEACYRWRSVG